MARRALAHDPMSFEAFRLLSEIYAERKEHETAAQFTRLGLDNYPEPTPSTPKFFFWILRIGALIIPRLKRVEKSAREGLADPDNNMRFSMQALNSIPKVNHWNIVLKCAKSKPCIDSRNSNRLATEISIDVPEMKNASKVAKAISHLVMLCGGSKVNSELFE